MAHKKGVGSSKNGRDSNSHRLGVKRSDGQIVLAGTIILWMGAQWLGGAMGWQTRFVFLFDFAALAAFIWALVVTYQIWRGRQT